MLKNGLFSTLLILSITMVFTTGCGGGGSDSSSGSSNPDTARACEAIGLTSRIFNGETCGNTASAAVVRVIAQVNVNGTLVNKPICSGSLVTPDTVLTAAHCFVSEVEGFPVVDLGIFIGEPGVGQFLEGVGYSAPRTFRYSPAVDRYFDDAALIRMERSVSNPVLPILLSRIPQVGESGFVYGYGARLPGQSNAGRDFFTLEAGAMTIANITQNHVFVFFDGAGVNVCNGDSGGPIVVLVEGQPALAGITSQGSVAGCLAGDVTTFTNVHSPGVFDWLVENVPNALVRSFDNTPDQDSKLLSYEDILKTISF